MKPDRIPSTMSPAVCVGFHPTYDFFVLFAFFVVRNSAQNRTDSSTLVTAKGDRPEFVTLIVL